MSFFTTLHYFFIDDDVFNLGLYKRVLSKGWMQRLTNVVVLRRVGRKRELMKTIIVSKVAYLGHVLKHTRYKLLKLIIMGKVGGKRSCWG